MEITSAQFIKGIKGTDPITERDCAHVAFLGRSNVGKSSTINALTNRKSLVKSSATPGKTQEINYFLINDDFYFVDLPGYGYAKVSKKIREKLRRLIWWYITDTRPASRTFVIVLDASVGMTDYDLDLFNTLVESDESIVIVVNKIDKLNQSDAHRVIQELSSAYSVPVVPFSAKKRKGIPLLLGTLFA